MGVTFERKSDCLPVEKLIWDYVCQDYGYFAGVRKLNIDDLLRLKEACNKELTEIYNEGILNNGVI